MRLGGPLGWSWLRGGVTGQAEQVVEALGGEVDLGEHPPSTGPSSFALVEQHRLLDGGKARQEGSDAEVEPCSVGFADHEPGDCQGEHANATDQHKRAGQRHV